MAKSKEQRWAEVHQKAMVSFNQIQSTLYPERMQSLEDRRFCSIAGAQWEGPLQEQFGARPRFEVNKTQLAVTRVISEQRNNEITVDFVSKDGSPNPRLADTCDSLYRADEQDSVASEAYDNSFVEGATGGFGAWRYGTEYENQENEEDDRQRIRIKPIFDADKSVFFDLNAQRYDKSDARECFVLHAVTRDDFIEEWGEAMAPAIKKKLKNTSSMPQAITQTEFDWFADDVIYLAEYYRVEDVSETIRVFKAVDGSEERYTQEDFEEDPELENTLSTVGSHEIRRKKVSRRRVHKYLISGSGILSDEGYIAGPNIPVVPFYAQRWYVDNIERCMGIVRLAKDSQRLKNMQISRLAEIAALSVIEKPIFTAEQVLGHANRWSEDNIKNYPYLTVNALTDAQGQKMPMGPVGYTKVPQIPPATAALMQITDVDMQEVLGNPAQSEKMVSNISGDAIEMIQTQRDRNTYVFFSNFARSMQRGGEIWLGMAKAIYIEEKRKMKGLTKEGKPKQIELMRPVLGESGVVELDNDLSRANFDVVATAGPASSSKRAATVRALTGAAAVTQDPEVQQILASMILLNIEGEGMDEAREYFRQKLLRMGVVKPTEEEAQQLAAETQNKPPDPNAVYLAAAAEEAQAKAVQARASTVKTIADAEYSQARSAETQAKTLEILAEVEEAERIRAMRTLGLLETAQNSLQPQAPQAQPVAPPVGPVV